MLYHHVALLLDPKQSAEVDRKSEMKTKKNEIKLPKGFPCSFNELL